MAEKEELEVFVDPQSMTVTIHPGEMVIMPVDCDVMDFVQEMKKVPGIEAYPLPDSRVAVKRIQ